MTLTELLLEHQHQYDGDCGDDFGCSCGGYTIPTDRYSNIDYNKFASHLAEVLTREGYSK